MITMKVYRNKRNSHEEMLRIIDRIWNKSGSIIYRDAIGVAVESSESIVNSFLFVQDVYADNLNVKIHALELVFTKDQFDSEEMYHIVQSTLFYFGTSYQCFTVVEEYETEYRAVFGINACSYNRACKFTDNNHAYIKLRDMLVSLAGEKVTFIYDQTVLFTDQLNKGNNYLSVNNV